MPRPRRTAAALAVLLAPAAAVGRDGNADAPADPPLPELPTRPADDGEASSAMPGGGMMTEGNPAPVPLVSAEPPGDAVVPVPGPPAGERLVPNDRLTAEFGQAGGPCLPFGPPRACGVGPADRCVGLPYAGFLYYGTPACDDDPLNRTWTACVDGLGEPAAGRVARHARDDEAAPAGRKRWSWLPWVR